MNTIRSLMTVFLMTVVAAAILGWRWSVALPSPKLQAARVVLALAGLSALGATFLLWRIKPQKSR